MCKALFVIHTHGNRTTLKMSNLETLFKSTGPKSVLAYYYRKAQTTKSYLHRKTDFFFYLQYYMSIY